MSEIFNRAELLLGKDVMDAIANQRIIILGVGGVGSWCAESLIRSGVQHLTIVDADVVSVTNVNRQLMATTKTIGQVKVEAMRNHLLDINPEADITVMQKIYSHDTAEEFHINDYDYVIDCIDSLKDKIDLLLYATEQPHPMVFSSMGAALKIDPTQIKVAEYWNVRGCPLGAAMRKRMRQRKQKLGKKVLCVYSEELLENKGAVGYSEEGPVLFNKAQTNGTLAHITAIFGFTLAGLVLQDINNKTK